MTDHNRWVSYDQLVYYIMTKKRLEGVTMTHDLLDQEVANYEQRVKKRSEDEVVFGLFPDEQEENEIEYCIFIS
jgi:hypothetical protein